jgi:RNA-directed DNA polymerase
MIEQILKGKNIRSACQQVVSNKGSAGVDGMTVKELPHYLKSNQKDLWARIRSDRYFVQGILGVEIPKENGKKRLLGIPTVVDRLWQQAVHQIISPMFEVEFTEYSYGFRPHRNAHQAILQAQKYIHNGCNYIVDIDLKSFFDEVDHEILLRLLFVKVKCPVTLRLIRQWLRAPIEINGKHHAS